MMAYEQLKQRQSIVWGTGPYQRITETLEDIHERVIDRVVPRPDRTWLVLANWTPTSGIADLFELMAPYTPAPPPSNPFDWGDEDVVEEFLGESFSLTVERYDSPVEFPSGEAYWELFSSSYGPTRTLAAGLGERQAELQRAWVDFFETHHRSNGHITHSREYLLVIGERRASASESASDRRG